MKTKLTVGLIFFFNVLMPKIFGLQNHVGSHDPSSIIKDGNYYWIFTTGDGIYTCNSTDLIKWTAAKTPFTKTNYPSWIKNYVSNFDGTFWAPECIYMNGKYYLYYACSTFGSKVSCIGLATTTSLNNPSWKDEGVVVYSNNSTDFNAIDPDVFFDASGNLWITYGSWNSGIKMQQLNKSTGKPIHNTRYSVCTFSDAENSQVVRNGSYYYLFVNRGNCCQGSNSTYYIQVGRSTSVNGPYSGWRTILSTSNNFVGPGAIGYFSENGTEYATFHYYDQDDHGNPKLAIGKFTWRNGWPIVTLNWLADGIYQIKNVNSNLVWDAWGCTGTLGQAIAQGTWNNLTCQKWQLTQLGNGYYKITCALGSLAADAIYCSPNAGTKLQLYSYSGLNCQVWRIERTNSGSYVISSKNGNRVVEVPNANNSTGIQLQLWDYNGNNCQKWNIATTSLSDVAATQITNLSTSSITVIPNPTKGSFVVQFNRTINQANIKINIYSISGQLIHSTYYSVVSTNNFNIDTKLTTGTYLLSAIVHNEVYWQKIIIE